MNVIKLMKSIQNLPKAKPLAKSDVPDGATPRQEAAAATAKDLTGEEYKHARKSKFKNKGEDIAHSARHKVNQWKGLQDAEKSGQAEKMVKLDTMLKHDPPNIMPKDGNSALKHLAAHYALAKFPKSPVVSKRYESDDPKNADDPQWHESERDGKTWLHHSSQPAQVGATLKKTWSNNELKARARQIYVDGYKRMKAKAEELVATAASPAHVVKGMRDEIAKYVGELRKNSGAYQRDTDGTLSDMFVDYANKTLRWGHRPKTAVYGALNDFESAFKKKYGHMGGPGAPGTPDEFYGNVLKHTTDVMEGKPLTKTFGLDPKEVRRFDPVEAYISTAERSGPEYGWKGSDDHDGYLMNTAKMRGLQYGNSVTDPEREHHLKHAAHAMRDLAETLDLPHEMVSFNGRLGLALGARGHGRALAHYEPQLKTINLTRANGVGSLAHEWGHFFDNVLPETMGRGKSAYGSEDFPHNKYMTQTQPEDHREEAENIRGAMQNVMKFLNNDVDGRIRKEYRAGNPQMKGISSEKMSNYWLSGRELFARAFEKYIDKKLRDKGRVNTYLAGVSEHPLWPTQEETAKVQPLFDELFKHFKGSKYLKKSIRLAKRLDRKYEVPYGAGYDVCGGHFYADKRLPREMTLKDGRKINTDKYLEIHERAEKAKMKEGYGYKYSHEYATGVERKAVEADKVPWDEYQTWMLGEIKKLTKLSAPVPPQIDLKPERDYNDKKMIREASAHGAKDLSKSELPQVASVALIDGDRLLMGKRNDNQRWTLPGGHLNPGETPCEGAARELFEEAGVRVKPTDLVHLGSEEVTTYTGKRMVVHAFALHGYHDTNTERDPDEEVQQWQWVDVGHGLPKAVAGALHSPKNTTLKALGLQ